MGIDNRIGQGGTAEVLKVTNDSGSYVLKLALDSSHNQEIIRENEVLEKLKRKGIEEVPTVYGLEERGGRQGLKMEYLGNKWKNLEKIGSLELAKIGMLDKLFICGTVAHVLQKANSIGLINNDVGIKNVFIDGEIGIKVVDWANCVDRNESNEMKDVTQFGDFLTELFGKDDKYLMPESFFEWKNQNYLTPEKAWDELKKIQRYLDLTEDGRRETKNAEDCRKIKVEALESL
jgi:RIO-like serine/threonine protein kinase